MLTFEEPTIEFAVPPPRRPSPHDGLIVTLMAKAEPGNWNVVTLESEAAVKAFRLRLHATYPKTFSTRLDACSPQRLYVRRILLPL